MDYTNFILGKKQEPNPLYDKRTKAGRAQPKFVTIDDINHVNDSMDKILEHREKDYWSPDWNETERKNFQSYGVIENQVDSERQLEKRRAQNQSGWEQMARSLGQIAVNEVILGSVLGLSDLTDWLINIGNDLGKDDYTNPISQALIDAQDAMKERLAIYRENPDTPLNITDSGWWWDNFVNVGSSVSLLLPSMGVTAGLGKIGKFAKLAIKGNKFDRTLYKADRWMGKIAKSVGIENPYNVKNALVNFKDAAIPSVISRQMEDMLEARETYNDTYEKSMQQLSNMTEAERQKFYERNKDIVYDENGQLKSDDEIARYIADKAATYTFVNDFKYIGFDFLQFGNILRFGAKPLTLGTFKTTRDVLRQMAVGTEKAADDLLKTTSRSEVIKDAIKFYAKNPKISIPNIAAKAELTEGIEEMGQGITQDNAKAVYEKLFNPNFTNRTLMSQLSDAQLWEQGIWGALGGITFNAAGKGLKKGKNYIYKKIKGDKLSEQDIKRLEYTEESIRQDEINSRLTAARTLEAKLALWKEGYNPQQKRYDENGREIIEDYSNKEDFDKMSDEESQIIFDNIINEYLTDMVTSAVDVGNGDLLQSFIESEEFEQFIDRIGGNNETIANARNKMLERFKEIKNSYYKNLETVFGSIDVESEYIGKAIATGMTRNEMRIKDLENEITRLKNATLKNTDIEHYDNYIERKQIGQVNKAIGQLLKEQQDLISRLNDKTVNKTFVNSRLKEIDKSLSELYKIGTLQTQYQEAYQKALSSLGVDVSKDNEEIGKYFAEVSRARNEELEKEAKNNGNIPYVVKYLADRRVEVEIQLALAKSFRIESQEELEDVYNDFMASHFEIIDSRFTRARNRILKYIEESDNSLEAYNSLFDETAPKDIQEDFDLFKVGDENYAYHLETFKLAANIKEKKKQMAVPKTNNQTSDNTTLETDEEIENTPSEQQSPSTGVQIESENNVPEEVNEPDEDDIAVQEIIENNGLEEIPIEVNEIEYSDEDIRREGFIRSIVPTKLKDASNETRIGIRENGIEGEEFKDFIKSCVDDLKQNPIFKNISEQDLTRTIEQEFANTLELISPSSSINIQNVYNKLINDIRNKKYSAETKLITNSDIENEVDKIIDNYLRDYENKDIPIDLRDFFDYIVENYQGNLVNILNPIIYRFTQDINSDTHKYKINEKTSYLIQKYKESPTKFLQELLSRKTKNSLISDELPSFHSQMPADAYNGFKYIQLRNIKGEKEATEEIFGRRNIKIVDNGINRTEVNETEIRRDEAIQAYIDWFTAIQNYQENPEAKLIVYQVGAAFNIRLYDASVSLLDLQKPEHLNKTIAFLARVEPILINGKNNNNAFAKIVTKNSYGLRYKVYKSDDGTITTNFDDLYNRIINDDVIYNMILNEQTNFSKDELKQLYDYFKDYINVKKDETAADIILKDYNGKSLSENNARDLLRYLHEIFGNYRERGGNKKSAQESFDEFKEKLYSNYSLTYALDSRFEENKKNHRYTVLDLREIPTAEEIITQVKNSYPINKEKFDAKTAKLVYVDNDYRIHIGNSDKSFDNPFNIHTNNIGIILKEYDDGRLPLIALSMGGNLIKDTNPLYSPLRNTIAYLVKQCYDANKSGNSIKILIEQLKELIGKESVFYRKPSDGYKSFVDEVVKLVYKQRNYSEELVDKLMNGITFNPSVALAKGKLDSTNNFISIDNGKLTITLPNEKGDITFNYDSYVQFCIENEAFNINQDLTVDPNIPNTILFDSSIKELSSTPSSVKGGKVLRQISALKKALDELGENDKIETKRVLKIAGFTEKDIATLLGENSNISFIDGTIKFDKNSQDEDFAYYDKRSSDIYLTNRIFNEEYIPTEIDTFRYNIARLIIHENVHKNFDKLSKDDKKVVINHLKDIFLDFADYYITDIDTSANNKLAKSIAKGFENTRWSLDNIKDLKKLIEENTIEEDELIDSMNEFLAETLSQPYLIKYLDSKEYRRERINVEDSDAPKDSIWTKIVRLIVEFFNKIESNFFENLSINNLDNSEKISIFAEEYKLLSILGGDKIVTKKDSIVVARDNVGKDGQLSLQFDEEPTTEQIDNLIDEEAEDAAIRKSRYTKKKISAQTPMITLFEVRSKINDDNGNFDNSGIRRVPSMTDFVKSRKYTEQAVISSLLNSGAFEYACK